MFHDLRFMLRLLELRRVPRKSPAEVGHVQHQRLRGLVRHAVERSPFYREKYRGIDPDRFELPQLPPVTKRELMEHFDRAVTDPEVRRADVERFLDDPANVSEYFLGKYVVSHTSGSQGQPLLIVQDRACLDLLFGLQFTRGNNFTGINPAEAVRRWLRPARLAVVTLRPGFYPSASAFAHLPNEARRYARVGWFYATDPDLTDRLNEYRPSALIAYAFVLETLALRAGRLRLAPELRQVVNNSEQLTARARARIAEAFGVPILDNYATGECPFLTNGCPAGPGAHLNADWAALEVVDDEYRPVPAGQLGRKVLITNLANKVQPVIRYEVNDMVALATEPCACGSRLPRIGRIEGRAEEEFWVEDRGEYRLVLSSVFKNACDYLRGVREWQAVQEERNRIRVRLEPLPATELDPAGTRRTLMEKLRMYGLPEGVAVDLELVPAFGPTTATGKFRRIISRVGTPADVVAPRFEHEAEAVGT